MHIITHKSEMQYLEFMLMCNSTPFEIVLLSCCARVVLSICASAVRFISTIYENKLFLNVSTDASERKYDLLTFLV